MRKRTKIKQVSGNRVLRTVQLEPWSWLLRHLCDQQPKHDHQSNKQKESRQELFIHVLRGSRGSWGWSSIIDVKSCGKNAKWKGTNAKRHLESSISKTETLKSTTIFRLWPLSLWSRRRSLPWVLLARASPAIQWDDFLSTDACFAHWTHLSVRSGLQPLM